MGNRGNAVLLGLLVPWAALATEQPRSLPRPLPGHPGNVFLRGEKVVVALPRPYTTNEWRLLDYESNIIAHGAAADGKATLGKLPEGYYQLNRLHNGVSEGPTISIR